MMLSRELLNEFKEIYQEEFSVELSEEELIEKATQVLNLFQTLVQPSGKNPISNSNVDLLEQEMQL